MSTTRARALEPSNTYAASPPAAVETAKMLTRVALGWFLCHQGWGKVVQDWTEGPGTFYRSNMFQNSNPAWLPDLIAAPYGFALPWFEFVFGALLILGLFNRVSAGAATLIFLSITIAWMNAGNLLPRHMLMIFTPLAAYFFLTGPGRYSLDGFLQRRATGGE